MSMEIYITETTDESVSIRKISGIEYLALGGQKILDAITVDAKYSDETREIGTKPRLQSVLIDTGMVDLTASPIQCFLEYEENGEIKSITPKTQEEIDSANEEVKED